MELETGREGSEEKRVGVLRRRVAARRPGIVLQERDYEALLWLNEMGPLFAPRFDPWRCSRELARGRGRRRAKGTDIKLPGKGKTHLDLTNSSHPLY